MAASWSRASLRRSAICCAAAGSVFCISCWRASRSFSASAWRLCCSGVTSAAMRSAIESARASSDLGSNFQAPVGSVARAAGLKAAIARAAVAARRRRDIESLLLAGVPAGRPALASPESAQVLPDEVAADKVAVGLDQPPRHRAVDLALGPDRPAVDADHGADAEAGRGQERLVGVGGVVEVEVGL